MMIIFACTSSTLIPHRPTYVMTSKCDVPDLTYDVIRVTARDFLALCALNIHARCLETHHLKKNCTGNTLVKVSCRYVR
jgi:hypothetical protein